MECEKLRLLKVMLIESHQPEREWIESTLNASGLDLVVTSIVSLVNKSQLRLLETINLLLVSEEQCPRVLKKLEYFFALKDIPFAILVLSKRFGDFDLAQYQNFTLEVFPKYALTPQILSHLILALQKSLEKDNRLKKLAHYDNLTGATSRHLFNDRLKQALFRAKRFKEPISMLYLDLDRFKQVNDIFGHAAGDELLIQFVHIIKGLIRESDTVGRLGGDEFAIILPKSNGGYAQRLANKILASLNQPAFILKSKCAIKTSIGIVTLHGNEDPSELTVDSIVRKADAAVYEAKANGREQIAVFTTSAERLLSASPSHPSHLPESFSGNKLG